MFCFVIVDSQVVEPEVIDPVDDDDDHHHHHHYKPSGRQQMSSAVLRYLSFISHRSFNSFIVIA